MAAVLDAQARAAQASADALLSVAQQAEEAVLRRRSSRSVPASASAPSPRPRPSPAPARRPRPDFSSDSSDADERRAEQHARDRAADRQREERAVGDREHAQEQQQEQQEQQQEQQEQQPPQPPLAEERDAPGRRERGAAAEAAAEPGVLQLLWNPWLCARLVLLWYLFSRNASNVQMRWFAACAVVAFLLLSGVAYRVLRSVFCCMQRCERAVDDPAPRRPWTALLPDWLALLYYFVVSIFPLFDPPAPLSEAVQPHDAQPQA